MEANIDRISNLPEPVLSNILSYLPTRDQISTALLSKAWTSLWTSVADLDFDSGDGTDHDRFAKFVDTAFLRSRPYSIRKLRINCDYCTEISKIASWVRTAIARNVQELELHRCNSPKLFFPILASCENLVILKLFGSIFAKFGDSNVRFPNLKALHLNWEVSVPNLLSRCPVLEELGLDKCSGNDIMIFVPALRSLAVTFHYYATCNIVVDSPALENLYFYRHFFGNSYDPSMQLLQLLSTLPRLKFLKISCFPQRKSTLLGSFNGFPVLNNLISLEIDIYKSYDWFRLLESCHNLESIVLCKRYFSDKNRTRSWNQPRVVPKCFSSKLKTFEFQRFMDTEDEISMARYVLENAMVLKSMVIMIWSHIAPEKKRYVESQLLSVEKTSKECQLIFK